ncbi:MAG TPA: histidinol dehydrogenase [Armatimonadetes bacterium]|nr:histidinol dehydrogenase [Armatimonadota bacterium]
MATPWDAIYEEILCFSSGQKRGEFLKVRRLGKVLRILHQHRDEAEIQRLLSRSPFAGTEEQAAVAARIVEEVRREGNAAVLRYTRQFDCPTLTVEQMRVSEEEIESAQTQVSEEFRAALRRAKDNLTDFHQRQRRESWLHFRETGGAVGQRFVPLARVGMYVPGGQVPLPSSVLALGVPARVAGVEELVLCSPCDPEGKINPHTLTAAAALGIGEIYKIGGAQAIAALAFGTETIRPVDKIVGPGNPYVTHAKRLVFGYVGIDRLAGPSEILILADDTANPRCVAADLLSQAEHSPDARALLITPSGQLAEAVRQEMEQQMATAVRREVMEAALRDYGALIVVDDLAAGVELVNRCAPEHLELLVQEPYTWLPHIRHAGAIFLGEYSPESVGDYLAGPSHVLPTGGTARFSSPVTVDDFLKVSSIIAYRREELAAEAEAIVTLATVEGLEAHARAVQVRTHKGEQP